LFVAVALAGFVLVAAAVVWRRSTGIAHARELRALDARLAQLVAERAALESSVRQAASRGQIGDEVVHRLGMRVPSDTQVILLPRPAAPVTGAARDTAPSLAPTP
jgi:hypothetical protein